MMRKWKCTKNEQGRGSFTVGKIYESDDFGCGLINDIGTVFSTLPVTNTEKDGLFFRNSKFEEVKDFTFADFTLADLKPFMVVELRDGRLAMVVEIEDCLNLNLLSDLNYGITWLASYSADLTQKEILINGKSGYDIMKVYGFSRYYHDILSIESRELIWERKEKSPTQIKLEELEAKQREIADEMAKLRKEVE